MGSVSQGVIAGFSRSRSRRVIVGVGLGRVVAGGDGVAGVRVRYRQDSLQRARGPEGRRGDHLHGFACVPGALTATRRGEVARFTLVLAGVCPESPSVFAAWEGILTEGTEDNGRSRRRKTARAARNETPCVRAWCSCSREDLEWFNACRRARDMASVPAPWPIRKIHHKATKTQRCLVVFTGNPAPRCLEWVVTIQSSVGLWMSSCCRSDLTCR